MNYFHFANSHTMTVRVQRLTFLEAPYKVGSSTGRRVPRIFDPFLVTFFFALDSVPLAKEFLGIPLVRRCAMLHIAAPPLPTECERSAQDKKDCHLALAPRLGSTKQTDNPTHRPLRRLTIGLRLRFDARALLLLLLPRRTHGGCCFRSGRPEICRKWKFYGETYWH